MADSFRTLIIPAIHTPLARMIAASFGPGGQGMWTTGLSPTGQEPASHYISSGYIPAQFAYMVPCAQWAFQDGAWVVTDTIPGDATAVYQVAQAAGIDCTQSDVDALFSESDVTEQEPFVAMERMNLKIVQANSFE